MSHNIMNKIISFDDKYEFTFMEDKNIKFMHPVSDYFLKLDDLSINLLISLKWIEWGYKFFTLISSNLDKISDEYNMCYIISKSIQKLENIPENEKILLIDDNKILDFKDYENMFKNIYLNPIFNSLFDENTKIHIKLKLNLREYLIISEMLYPTFIKLDK